MRVIHHQRLPYSGQVSIERLFAEIREFLPEGIDAVTATSPRPSTGLLPRLANMRFAGRQAGDLHHIVGDAHYLAFALPRKRTVLTIHDCAALNRLSGWKLEILRYFWFTGPMRRAAVVTTISQTTKDELRRWVGDLADKVLVIPNCVRSEFTPAPKPFHSDAPVVLQIGTGWNKNVERVAEALRGTPCRLEVVGEMRPAQRASLERMGVPYRELGRISDEDLVDAYRHCDFVVFASIYEGFGLPILEAQATGRPVITSNRSSMPEAAGDGALFVDPESVVGIHQAVNRLLNEPDLRSFLIERGFRNVARFHPKAIADRYVEVYKGLWSG
jgi:glycosyltransferase involved in cell wall biosynthesis